MFVYSGLRFTFFYRGFFFFFFKFVLRVSILFWKKEKKERWPPGKEQRRGCGAHLSSAGAGVVAAPASPEASEEVDCGALHAMREPSDLSHRVSVRSCLLLMELVGNVSQAPRGS